MGNINPVVIYIVLGIIGVIVLYIIYRKNFKILKVPSVCLITGGVKTGKSLLSVNLSIKDYKRRHRIWWWLTHVFGKKLEEPLYYTNVQISFRDIRKKINKKGKVYPKPHRLDKNIVTMDLDFLARLVRFNYKSVIYIQESSLMADNMDFNNQERNCDLSLFNKLIAHETRGGALYYDTQSVLDNHYSLKRVCSTYFFIQKNVNLLLFHILWVREMINEENGVNNFTDDVETSMRKVLIPFWYHHKYNRYEFSYLTDDLDTKNIPYRKHLGVISFNKLYVERADKRKKVEPKKENKQNVG